MLMGHSEREFFCSFRLCNIMHGTCYSGNWCRKLLFFNWSSSALRGRACHTTRFILLSSFPSSTFFLHCQIRLCVCLSSLSYSFGNLIFWSRLVFGNLKATNIEWNKIRLLALPFHLSNSSVSLSIYSVSWSDTWNFMTLNIERLKKICHVN